MKAWGLITLLLFSRMGLGQQQYYNTPLSSLSLSGTSSQTDLDLLPLKPGDTITPENVRAAIQSLYETGRYSYIEVDASHAESGTALTFRVRPHYFFSTFRLESENLLDRSLSSFFRLPLGEKFSQTELDRIVRGTTDALVAEGYFDARVTPVPVFNEETRLVSVTLRALVSERATIGTVQIEGGEQTFPPEELREAFGIETREDFSASDLEAGITRIRQKFSDLDFLNTSVTVDRTYSAETNTVDLKITVRPGVFVLVQPRGYEDISRNRLRELVPVFEEGAVDPDLVEEGRAEIARYMEQQGYFEAMVESEIIEAPLDNAIQIVYEIAQGEQHRIRDVSIEGNQFFSDDALKDRMQVRPAGFFSRGVFSSELLDEDILTILSVYRNAGFLDGDARGYVEESNREITVVIQIKEGPQYSIESLTFLGNFAISVEELQSTANIDIGQTYTPGTVEEARNVITTLYYERGYPDVRVEPTIVRTSANHGIEVTFQITEGEHYNIGEILIAGNTITGDKIIHRNSRIYPQSPYNPEAILEAQQSLYATGLFTRVEIVSLDQEMQGVRNLLIQVEDAKPILLTYGAGLQDREGARGTVEVSHSNLFGLDRSLSFRLRASRREQQFTSTFHEPWLFNHDLDGYASMFIERTHQPSFDADKVDFSFQVLKSFSPQLNLLFTASYQTVNLRDIRVNPRAEDFPEEVGIVQIAGVGLSFIQDYRNDPINPTAGTLHTTSFQVASKVLGSEVNFTSIYNQSSFYRPLRSGVLATSFRLGWNRPFGDTRLLPITERYFAGGSTTLRGFDLDEAGPEAGGDVLTIANVEYRVPLPILRLSGLGGALFYDTGNAFRRPSEVKLKEFTHSAGFGLRYQTPLGPVRLDFGFNLNPKIRLDGQREERMQVFFTLGQAF